ncbi:RNA binding protein, putative [Zymobacter palmae]|uniref:RNA binding protein, putative n=1 Tax=Zymobacter palmae TaxID=33074 RepID=A0A348HE30_9GAMM|nr:RNA binding protein, putative [Zymobacter palmae]
MSLRFRQSAFDTVCTDGLTCFNHCGTESIVDLSAERVECRQFQTFCQIIAFRQSTLFSGQRRFERFEGFTFFVLATQHFQPCCCTEGQTRNVVASFQVTFERIRPEYLDLGVGIARDTQQLISHCRVGKTVENRAFVFLNIQISRSIQRRDNVEVQEVFQQCRQVTVLHGFVNEFIAQQYCRASQHSVRSVQHADFDLLVASHVVCHASANSGQIRATCAELVFQNPVNEGFGQQRQFVLQTTTCIQFFDRVSSNGRRDTVNHSVRERDVRFDPLSQFSISSTCETSKGFLSNRTVVTQVVAGQDGERTYACITTTTQRFDHQTEHGLRFLRVGQVVLDTSVFKIELACVLVDVVATFSDGHADDADSRISQQLDDGFRVFRCVHVVDNGTNDTNGRAAVGINFSQRVQTVLTFVGSRFFTHSVVVDQFDTDDTPVTLIFTCQAAINIERFVSTEEVTHTEVNDTRSYSAAIVVGRSNGARQSRQGFIVEHLRRSLCQGCHRGMVNE